MCHTIIYVHQNKCDESASNCSIHSLPVTINFPLALIKSPVWLSGNRRLGTSLLPYCVQLLDSLALWEPGFLELSIFFFCFWWASIEEDMFSVNELWKSLLFRDLINVRSAHCKSSEYFLINNAVSYQSGHLRYLFWTVIFFFFKRNLYLAG